MNILAWLKKYPKCQFCNKYCEPRARLPRWRKDPGWRDYHNNAPNQPYMYEKAYLQYTGWYCETCDLNYFHANGQLYQYHYEDSTWILIVNLVPKQYTQLMKKEGTYISMAFKSVCHLDHAINLTPDNKEEKIKLLRVWQ